MAERLPERCQVLVFRCPGGCALAEITPPLERRPNLSAGADWAHVAENIFENVTVPEE